MTAESTATINQTKRDRAARALSLAPARRQGAKFAKRAVEFQQKTVLGAIERIGSFQTKSEDRIRRFTDDATFLPDEGKKLVGEWITLARKSRSEFKKSTEKSYGLVAKYFDRIGKESAKA